MSGSWPVRKVGHMTPALLSSSWADAVGGADMLSSSWAGAAGGDDLLSSSWAGAAGGDDGMG